MSTLRHVAIAASVGAGVTGGVYFAFSSFVMTGLRRLPGRDGLTAMQAINRAAPSPLFLTAMFGTALVAGGLVVAGVRRWGEPDALALITGSGLYLVSTAITVAFHVPRNDALAAVDPDATSAVATWSAYAADWTAGNHVRAAAAIAGAALLALAATHE